MASKLIIFASTLVLYVSGMADAQPEQPWNGPTWRLKVNKMFALFDSNHDGLHDDIDVQLMVNGWSFGGSFLVDAATEIAGYTSKFEQLWTELYACNTVPSAPLNAALLQQCLSALGPTAVGQLITNLVALFFPVYDTNADGFLDKTEFTCFFSNLHLDSNVIQASWTTLENGGMVSLAEWTAFFVDYYTTSDPLDKYNNIMGPIGD